MTKPQNAPFQMPKHKTKQKALKKYPSELSNSQWKHRPGGPVEEALAHA